MLHLVVFCCCWGLFGGGTGASVCGDTGPAALLCWVGGAAAAQLAVQVSYSTCSSVSAVQQFRGVGCGLCGGDVVCTYQQAV